MADWLITQKLKLATTFNPFGLFIAGFILMPIGFYCCMFGCYSLIWIVKNEKRPVQQGSPRSE